MQTVLGSQIALTAPLGFFLGLDARKQVTAEQRDEQRPGDQHAPADGREVEQPEGCFAGLLQRTADQQVGRCTDHCRQPTEQAAVGQRHEQFGSRDLGSPGYLDDHRQHQRGHADVVHERREHAGCQHDDHGHCPPAGARKPEHGTPDDVGDAGSRQAVAQNEHGPDGDDGAIGEPGHRILGRDQAGDDQRAQDKERSDVHANLLADEQHQRPAEDDQDQGDVNRQDEPAGGSELPYQERLHRVLVGGAVAEFVEPVLVLESH